MKTVFFAPHSALWVHAFPEALVGEALAQAGHEIVYVGCGRVFHRHCVPMSAHRLTPTTAPEERAAVCRACQENERLIRERFGFGGYDLADILDDADYSEAERLVAAANPENFLSTLIDGIEVGRAALSTFLLNYKRVTLTFTANEWEIFRIELRNTILSLLASRKVLERERPDRIVLYSSGYSVNLVWCLLAERRGIVFYYMNAGSNLSDRLQKIVLSRGHSLQRRLLDYWDRYRELPCTPATIKYVAEHVLELLRGRHSFVYSAPKSETSADIRKRFSVEAEQKILLATMSSYDELFAAQATGLFPSEVDSLFPSQIDWIKALIAFIERRPDLFLIVRVHPREFPNKRDSVKSEHALQLEKIFSALPPNARVNWPSDGLSLYDLADVTDVCLNAWSSVGKEMSLLGIPVVIYSQDLVFYPPDLNYLGSTLDAYVASIDQALQDGWNLERSRRAFRWQALEDEYSRINISDGFRFKEHDKRPLHTRLIGRLMREMDPLYEQKRDCARRAHPMKAAGVIALVVGEGYDSVLQMGPEGAAPIASEAEETRALRQQLGRIAAALGEGPAAPGTLRRHLQSIALESPVEALR